jgi:hypothetical protein
VQLFIATDPYDSPLHQFGDFSVAHRANIPGEGVVESIGGSEVDAGFPTPHIPQNRLSSVRNHVDATRRKKRTPSRRSIEYSQITVSQNGFHVSVEPHTRENQIRGRVFQVGGQRKSPARGGSI